MLQFWVCLGWGSFVYFVSIAYGRNKFIFKLGSCPIIGMLGMGAVDALERYYFGEDVWTHSSRLAMYSVCIVLSLATMFLHDRLIYLFPEEGPKEEPVEEVTGAYPKSYKDTVVKEKISKVKDKSVSPEKRGYVRVK